MENNFERHIRAAAENSPEFVFEERLWNDLEQRLERPQKTKPLLGFVGRLPLLLLALLMTLLSGLFYAQNHKAMKRIAVIEQQLNTQITNNSPIQDVTIEKKVTVVYDTIYREIEVLRNDNQNRNSRNLRLATFLQDFEQFKSDRTQKTQKLFTLLSQQHQSLFNAPLNHRKSNSSVGNTSLLTDLEKSRFEDQLSPIASITPRDLEALNISYSVDAQPVKIENQKKKRFNIFMNELRPTRFSFIGTTGTFASLNLGGNGFNLRSSAHAELGFNKRFSVIAGIEYFSNDFNRRIDFDEVDPLNGFPEIAPDDLEDELMNIKGDFNYLQIPFGLKYIVFPRRYFHPFVSGGLVATKTTRSRLEYDYASASTGLIYPASQSDLQTRILQLDGAWASIGFQVQMTRNWRLLVEGVGQFGIKDFTYRYENLQLVKLNTGVIYQF